MHAKTYSCTIRGLECTVVDVEVDITHGMPNFAIVGLGDTAIQESKERVRSAIKNSACEFPLTRKTINLAPADVKKFGPIFDLPIAIGILKASHQIRGQISDKIMFVGELALDGTVKPINGSIIMALKAREEGFTSIVVPLENAREAACITEIEVIGVRNLREVTDFLNEQIKKPIFVSAGINQHRNLKISREKFSLDMIKGQLVAKRAMMIAAAGRHNLLFSGPPGSGKTSLAMCMNTIMSELCIEESLEVSKIYSVAGLIDRKKPLIGERPFRSVHHTASQAALIGGGRDCGPGEISLAHKGVLFLDEIAEFPAKVLETLRQPLENKEITISRAAGSSTYPADFMLVAAMNPCPCGFLGDKERKCKCSEVQIAKYRGRISGPLIDRIDLFVEVPRLKFEELNEKLEKQNEDADKFKEKINKAIEFQLSRNAQFSKNEKKHQKLIFNNELSSGEVGKVAELDDECAEIMRKATQILKLSPRSYFRTIKVARTIADLEMEKALRAKHLKEALQFRPIAFTDE